MILPPPKGETQVSEMTGWNIYRTRFLVRAKQLTEPLAFVDVLGREHRGLPGDYLVESSDGRRSIRRKEIFEDVYVAMEPAAPRQASLPSQLPVPPMNRRLSTNRRPASA